MEIDINNDNDLQLTVLLTGRLDMIGARILDSALSAYPMTENKQLLMDMSNVEFIASIGIRSLVSKAKELKNNGGELILCNPRELVREVLETTGIDQIINIVENCPT